MTAHGHITADKPYGCHNRPRPTAETSYPAQDGWQGGVTLRQTSTRLPVIVPVTHVMSTTCQYDKSAVDQRCGGCEHGSAP